MITAVQRLFKHIFDLTGGANMGTKILFLFLSVALFYIDVFFVFGIWFRGKRNTYLKTFFILGLAISTWALFNGICVLLSKEIQQLIYPYYFVMVFITSPLFLLYILHFTESKLAFSRALRVFLFVIGAINFLALFTNPWHHEFIAGYDGLLPIGGRWFPIHAAISYGPLLFALVIFFRYIIKNIKKMPLLSIVGFAVILPLAFNILYTFDVVNLGFDITPFAFLLMFIVFSVYSAKFGLFDNRVAASMSLFHTFPDAVLIADEAGHITDANQSFKRAFRALPLVFDNTTVEEVESFFASIAVEQNPADIIKQIHVYGREIHNAEITLRMDDNLCYYVLSKNVIYERSRHVGFILTLVDVSNNQRTKQMIEEIEQNNARLQELNAIAESASQAKSGFLSHMSHEIRTPLNAILGMISIGLNTADVEKKDYCFERADSASKHLLGIINDVLDMSKIEADKFELSYTEINFEKMLISITNVANVMVEEKRQEFVVNFHNDIPACIESDELRLSQVITNLLTNAIKFTPESGTIILNVEKTDEAGDEVTLRIEVVDTGIGIAKAQQARLFESFTQADVSITKKFGGTGLGLAISRRIVELMGGTIWVESELGKGAKFIFTVKVKKLLEREHTELSLNIKPEDIRILAVDDSPETRDYFIDAMQTLKLPCEVAGSGAEALDRIKSAGDRPYNIFFVDWQMPELDGIELTKRIREIHGDNAIVIMISVGDWNAIEKEAIAAGVKYFLSKPLFPSTLINAINICVDEDLNIFVEQAERKTGKRKYDFRNYRLLIAEDVEINREIMSAVFEETGVNIDYAENGAVAVSMFRKDPEKYSLILMDVNMPEMDGYEATRQIRALDLARAKDIPIVAMTANVFKEDIKKCLESGMNDHTGKPVDADALFGVVNKYLTRPGKNMKMKNVHELTQGVAWTEDLLTGNALVDMQHQKMFERLNDLVHACADGSDTAKLHDTLEFLVNYTIRHFTDEEALQLEYGYPDYDAHRNEHEKFKATVGALAQRFKESGSSAELSGDVNRMIVRWLISHIQRDDKRLSEYIRSVNAENEKISR